MYIPQSYPLLLVDTLIVPVFLYKVYAKHLLVALSSGPSKSLMNNAVRVATQYTSNPCKLKISSYLFARWHLRHVGYI